MLPLSNGRRRRLCSPRQRHRINREKCGALIIIPALI